MMVKTQVRSGGRVPNHSEKLVSDAVKAKRLKVKTRVQAGGIRRNHSARLLRAGK